MSGNGRPARDSELKHGRDARATHKLSSSMSMAVRAPPNAPVPLSTLVNVAMRMVGFEPTLFWPSTRRLLPGWATSA